MNRPPGSRILVERGDFGVRVTLPSFIPPRIAAWAVPAVLLFMVGGPVAFALLAGASFPIRFRLIMAAFLGIPTIMTGLIGLSKFVRRWVFERNADDLTVTVGGLLGARTRRWPGAEILSLSARQSGTASIEDRGTIPVYDLVLELRSGKTVRLLKKGQDPRDLSWIAWNLQNLDPERRLAAPRSSSPPAPAARTQPAGSRAEVTSSANGVRIVLPPFGVARRAADGAMIGSLVLPVFSILALIGLFIFRPQLGHIVPVLSGALILFVVVGVVVVFFEVNHRKRRGEVVVARERLRISSQDLIGSETTEWAWSDIESVRCGPSGTTVNDVPRMALLITLRSGRVLMRFKGRDRAELDWVASVISRARMTEPVAEKVEMSAAGGICQVCSTAMSANRVFCAKCRTPHHEECWLYNGQCSTFGCREIRSTKS